MLVIIRPMSKLLVPQILLYLCGIGDGTTVNVKNSSIFRNNNCELPEHPTFGQWTVFRATSELTPGMSVPSGSVLQATCRSKYRLVGDTTAVCIDGEWSAPIGQCLKTCPPRNNTPFMQVNCTLNGVQMKDCKHPVHGTIARFRCADFYEDLSLKLQPLHVCLDGRWNYELPDCVPICGQKSVENPTLIVNGMTPIKGEYPWQVAIYNVKNPTSKILICGGTLINQKMVLTAAHCLTDIKGKLYSKKMYSVVVGKYYRNYDDPRDRSDAQYSQVQKIFIPAQYKGDTQNYVADIGIIITKRTFVLTSAVLPVCVDWDGTNRAFSNITNSTQGFVTGWGYTMENKNPSDVLKVLEVPTVTAEECRRNIPEDYEQFLTNDKFCAGFVDSRTAVCSGDSGGGLVSKYRRKFYIVGIVSSSPQAPTYEGGCDSQTYGLYTRVSDYIQSFILEKEAQFRPTTIDCHDLDVCRGNTTMFNRTDVDSCRLPQRLESREFSYIEDLTSSVLPPGVKVPSEASLKIKCKTGFYLVGEELVTCKKGKWAPEIGQCLIETCPDWNVPLFREVLCFYKGVQSSCLNPADGTVAVHQCSGITKPPNMHFIQTSTVGLCRNGTWDQTGNLCYITDGLIQNKRFIQLNRKNGLHVE